MTAHDHTITWPEQPYMIAGSWSYYAGACTICGKVFTREVRDRPRDDPATDAAAAYAEEQDRTRHQRPGAGRRVSRAWHTGAGVLMADLLTTTQVAAELGVSPQLIRRLVADKRIPTQRIGRDHLIDRAHLALLQDRGRAGRPRHSADAYKGVNGYYFATCQDGDPLRVQMDDGTWTQGTVRAVRASTQDDAISGLRTLRVALLPEGKTVEVGSTHAVAAPESYKEDCGVLYHAWQARVAQRRPDDTEALRAALRADAARLKGELDNAVTTWRITQRGSTRA